MSKSSNSRKIMPGPPCFIDYSFGLTLGDGSFFIVISGWIAGKGPNALVLLDSRNENPAILEMCDFPRPDVEKVYGPCADVSRKGYGFIAWAKIAQPWLGATLCGVFGKDIRLVSPIKIARQSGLAPFLSMLDKIPQAAFTAARTLILPNLSRDIGIMPNDGDKTYHAFPGRHASPPRYSLVIFIQESTSTLETQLLALSEDMICRESAEIIYILRNSPQMDSQIRIIEQLSAALGLSVGWMNLSSLYEKAAALNLGFQASRGQIIAIMDQRLIPMESGWLAFLDKKLNGPCVAASCGALDINGNALNGLYSLAISRFTGEAGKISLPDNLDQSPQGSAPLRFPDESFLLFKRDIFQSLTGFDTSYFNFYFSSADFCQKIISHGKSISYSRHYPFRLIQVDNNNFKVQSSRLASIHDGERFAKKWCSTKSD